MNDLDTIKKDYIILAGGCFWGMEDLFLKLPGVIECKVGYTGGSSKDPKYKDICRGDTGHAEAVKVSFQSNDLTLDAILDYFFKIHDPTTLNQQGNDKGTQYRSAIFVRNDEQREICKSKIKDVDSSEFWTQKIVTKIEDENEFYPAEEYHQKYLLKNPGGYTCHYIRK